MILAPNKGQILGVDKRSKTEKNRNLNVAYCSLILSNNDSETGEWRRLASDEGFPIRCLLEVRTK